MVTQSKIDPTAKLTKMSYYIKADFVRRTKAGLVDFGPGLILTSLAILTPNWMLFILVLLNSLFVFSRDSLLSLLFHDRRYRGISPGKQLFGLQVISLHHKEPVGIFESLFRNFLFVIPFFNYIALAVEAVVAYRDSHGMRLFDRVAGTAVIDAVPQHED